MQFFFLSTSLLVAICRSTFARWRRRQVRGDHYVTMKVAIPKDVSADERQLLEQLQEKSGGKTGGKKSKGGKGNKVRKEAREGGQGGKGKL